MTSWLSTTSTDAHFSKVVQCMVKQTDHVRGRLLSVPNADSVWPSQLISRRLVVMILFYISTLLICKQIFSLKGHDILFFLFIYHPLQLRQPLLMTTVNHPTRERLFCCIDPSRLLGMWEKKRTRPNSVIIASLWLFLALVLISLTYKYSIDYYK